MVSLKSSGNSCSVHSDLSSSQFTDSMSALIGSRFSFLMFRSRKVFFGKVGFSVGGRGLIDYVVKAVTIL